MVLPYLKSEHVTIGRYQINASEEAQGVIAAFPHLNEFVQYFDTFWMTCIENWNIFSLDDHYTNNDVEGWHYDFNQHLTRRGQALGFWPFVEMIGARVLVDNEAYLQLENGMQLTTRSPRSINQENNIKRMKILYASNCISSNHEPGDQVHAYTRGLRNNY